MNDFIKNYWENQAVKHKDNYKTSWEDIYAIELECKVIENLLFDNSLVLDVGCGNGYSILSHKNKKNIKFYGIDFSENMIKYANENKEKLKASNYNFSEGNILEIPFNDETFDFVYTTRTLINLPTWELQKKAIIECLRVTKNTGRVAFLEAFCEPFMKLNSIRKILDLKPLVQHDFNKYLGKGELEKLLNELNYSYENIDYSSIYYMGSRIIREIINDNNDLKKYDNILNEDFFKIQKKYQGGNVGIQQAYIIKK